MKVMFGEVLCNKAKYAKDLSDAFVSKREKAFFFAYGMSMVALLTDYVARISKLKISLGNDDQRTAI